MSEPLDLSEPIDHVSFDQLAPAEPLANENHVENSSIAIKPTRRQKAWGVAATMLLSASCSWVSPENTNPLEGTLSPDARIGLIEEEQAAALASLVPSVMDFEERNERFNRLRAASILDLSGRSGVDTDAEFKEQQSIFEELFEASDSRLIDNQMSLMVGGALSFYNAADSLEADTINRALIELVETPRAQRIFSRYYESQIITEIDRQYYAVDPTEEQVQELRSRIDLIEDASMRELGLKYLDYALASDLLREGREVDLDTYIQSDDIRELVVDSANEDNWRTAFDRMLEIRSELQSGPKADFDTFMDTLEEGIDDSIDRIEDESLMSRDAARIIEEFEPGNRFSPTESFNPVIDRSKLNSFTLDNAEAEVWYQEFAHVEVIDNQLVVVASQEGSIDDASLAQLNRIVDAAGPLIVAALESGNLEELLFTVDTEGSMYLNHLKTALIDTAPEEGGKSMQDIMSSLVHEVVHSLVRDAHHEREVTEYDYYSMLAVCDVLSTQAFDTLNERLGDFTDEDFDILTRAYALEDSELVSTFRQILDSGDLDQLNERNVSDLSFDENARFPNNCDVPGNLFVALEVTGSTQPDLPNYLEYQEGVLTQQEEDRLIEINRQWGEIVSQHTLMAEFREGRYVESSHADAEHKGHPNSGADELAASLITNTLVSNEAFRDAINAMSEEDRQHTITAIATSMEIVLRENEQLRPVLEQALQFIDEDAALEDFSDYSRRKAGEALGLAYAGNNVDATFAALDIIDRDFRRQILEQIEVIEMNPLPTDDDE